MARSSHRARRTALNSRTLPQYGVEPTKVLAVGNGQRFIEQISDLLLDETRIQLLGGAQNRVEAAERLVLLKPDVIVIEVDLDYELGGIDTAFALRSISPSTAFVLVSPYSDPERLAMVPRGLGLEWSYLVADGGLDKTELTTAINSASWSIPYIDSRIDRSKLSGLQNRVAKAVETVRLKTAKRDSGVGYVDPSDWNGNVLRFRLPDGENGNGGGV